VIEVEDYELQLLLLTEVSEDLEKFKGSDGKYIGRNILLYFKLLGLANLSDDSYAEFFSVFYRDFSFIYYSFTQEHGTPIANLRKALEKDPNGPLAFSEADNKIYKTLVDTFAFHTLGYNADSHLFRRFLINFPAKLIAHHLLEEVVLPNLDFFIGQNTTYFGKEVRKFYFDLFVRFLDLRCMNSYSADTFIVHFLSRQVAFYLNEILDNTRLKKLWSPISGDGSFGLLFENRMEDCNKFMYYMHLSLIPGRNNGSFREFYHFVVNDSKRRVFKEQGTFYYKYKKDNSICWKKDAYLYPKLTSEYFTPSWWVVKESSFLLDLKHYYLIHEFKFSDLGADLVTYYFKYIRLGMVGYLSSIGSYLKEKGQTDIILAPVRGLVIFEFYSSYLLDLQLRENVFEMLPVGAFDGLTCKTKLVRVPDCVSTAALTVNLDLNTLHDFAVYPDFYVESYEVYHDEYDRG
jgi:hypothetical protein